MKHSIKKQAFGLVLIGVLAGNSMATLVDFEAVADSSAIPSGYGGLDWTASSYVVDSSNYPGSGYVTGTISGTKVGLTWFEGTFGWTTGGTDFASLSFWMTAAWRDGVDVYHELLDGGFGGTVMGSGNLSPSRTSATQYFLTGSGVDTVTLIPSGGTNPGGLGGDGAHLAIDDIEYTLVPEPASMAVLGLGALTLMRRRK